MSATVLVRNPPVRCAASTPAGEAEPFGGHEAVGKGEKRGLLARMARDEDGIWDRVKVGFAERCEVAEVHSEAC